MNKHRQFRLSLLFLAWAILCAAIDTRAQGDDPNPKNLPVVSDHRQAASLIMSQSAPEYPPIAKINYIQGQVKVKLTVNGKGMVASAHVLNGDALLAESALRAVLRWLYRPLATPLGPSGFVTTVKLKFTLTTRTSDLTPEQAERDFMRQVKPCQLVRRPKDQDEGNLLHARLLINEQGQVVDLEIPGKPEEQAAAARAALRGWTFRPAHWGSLPIASYLDVDVPLRMPSTEQANARSVGD